MTTVKKKNKNLARKPAPMIWLPDALNQYGHYLYGDKWEADLWRLALNPEKNNPCFDSDGEDLSQRDREKFIQYVKGRAVLKKINNLLSSGELRAFMRSTENERDYTTLSVSCWQDEIRTEFYETGKVFGNPNLIYKTERPRKRPGRPIYLVKREFEDILLIAPELNQKSNAGRKHKFNYGHIVSIIVSIIECGEKVPSQDRFACRIQEIYGAIYSKDDGEDVPAVSTLKEQILEEFYNSRDGILKYIQENPPSYQS